MKNRIVPTPDATGTPPDYADNGIGFPVFRGPYLQKDAHCAAFLFNADAERLTTLCDKTLNVSQTFRYRYIPFTSSVMLVFADMLVSSRDERDTQIGLIPETEVSFWVLTVAMQKTRGGYIPHHLAWFLPYLLVDEANAIATGREVFGFNKLAAQFQKPGQIQKPEFTADVLGFKQFGTDSIACILGVTELFEKDKWNMIVDETSSEFDQSASKVGTHILEQLSRHSIFYGIEIAGSSWLSR